MHQAYCFQPLDNRVTLHQVHGHDDVRDHVRDRAHDHDHDYGHDYVHDYDHVHARARVHDHGHARAHARAHDYGHVRVHDEIFYLFHPNHLHFYKLIHDDDDEIMEFRSIFMKINDLLYIFEFPLHLREHGHQDRDLVQAATLVLFSYRVSYEVNLYCQNSLTQFSR